MRMLVATVCAALAWATPAAAQENWSHAASGVSVARGIGDMQLNREQDASGSGHDVILQYGSGPTAVTLYVYRSAYPNAALWFERTRLAMNAHVGSPERGVDPRPITVGGASAPNGLREDIAIPGGQMRATSVAIVQVGEWIVKARVSSSQLDLAGVAERMDRLIGALRFELMPAPHPLRVPPVCADERRMDGAGIDRSRQAVAAAVAAGSAVADQARGRSGLAADPAAWCRVAAELPAQYGAVYRDAAGSAWVALIGDSGRAVSGVRLAEGGDVGAATYVSTPGAVAVAGLYRDLPDPDAGLIAALPIVVGQQRGLAEIGER